MVIEMPGDEILMAFVDGELGERERGDVEKLLENDPQARVKVEKFRKTRKAIDSFAGILDERVPDRLVETIRRHGRNPEAARVSHGFQPAGWLRLAASLFIGISLGAIGTKYSLDQINGRELTVATARIASLSNDIKVARKKISVAEDEINAARNEISAARDKIKVANEVANEVSAIFPLSLVSQALRNGSRVPSDVRAKILAELNSRSMSLSKLAHRSTDEGLATNASRYESLNDLQPARSRSRQDDGRRGDVNTGDIANARFVNTLGEFSYAGKSCRMFEYGHGENPVIACKKETGEWEIVKARNIP